MHKVAAVYSFIMYMPVFKSKIILSLYGVHCFEYKLYLFYEDP
jgi:hypothetical protein